MLGYFDDQAATETALNSQGWFMTGDLGRIDERGYLHVNGRLKDVIIRGGHNIHPARIEMLAMRHPQVERAAAVGVKDERLGEKVCIVVLGKNGVRIEPDRLLSHLHAESLSPYEMPEYFLQVDDLPLSASGRFWNARSLIRQAPRFNLSRFAGADNAMSSGDGQGSLTNSSANSRGHPFTDG